MSNAARRFVGDAGERGTAPSPDRGRGAGIANKEENGCSNTAAGGVAVSSRERNDLTTAIQAPRRYFETSLQYLRSFWLWSLFGLFEISPVVASP